MSLRILLDSYWDDNNEIENKQAENAGTTLNDS